VGGGELLEKDEGLIEAGIGEGGGAGGEGGEQGMVLVVGGGAEDLDAGGGVGAGVGPGQMDGRGRGSQAAGAVVRGGGGRVRREQTEDVEGAGGRIPGRRAAAFGDEDQAVGGDGAGEFDRRGELVAEPCLVAVVQLGHVARGGRGQGVGVQVGGPLRPVV